MLSSVYSDAPSLQNVSVNGNAVDRASVMENEAVNMSCTFDSNPAPTVMWTSKENTSLMLQNDSFVLYQSHRVMQNGIPRILYTSYFFIAQTGCTQTGEYFCKARNPRDSVTDGTVHLFVKCKSCFIMFLFSAAFMAVVVAGIVLFNMCRWTCIS